jgi:predicted peptidase
MTRRNPFVTILVLTALSGLIPCRVIAESGTPNRRPTAPAPKTPGKLIEGKAGYDYVCFLPPGYSRQSRFYPLIVFLHGASPDEDLEKLKRFGPIKFALDHDDFPFIAVAPASSKGWSVRILDSFLRRVESRFRVDRNRIYLTGLSMGGHATWTMALAYPSRFAAVAPVCGAGDPQLAAAKLRHLPVWIFHGEKDTVVPVACGRVMADALKKVAGNVKLTIYPDLGHNIWQETYENVELYRWFLQHQRNEKTDRTPPPRVR